jgi:CHAT domain-containing protein
MLVVKNGDVTAVHLPDLTLAALEDKEKKFNEALTNRKQDPDGAKDQLLSILEWLWRVCGKPLVDQMGFTRSTGIEKPRVWWIPGGLLGRLPLHACGVYPPAGDQRNEQSMFDYVVSSYAPTLRSLGYSIQRAAQVEQTEQRQAGALIVAVPESEGSGVLHNAVVEANEVQTNFNRSKLLTNPSFQEVVCALPNSEMVHFACHGITNFKDPGSSYLKLKDHNDNPLTVEALMKLKLSHCRLAYLSACDTAYTTVGNLVDESLHLVSGFMLAGCPRVIGTLWKIPDDRAREVAARFYSHLPHQHGRLDTSNSAMALHCAIDELRKTSAGMHDPLVWTAFIHAGA